VSDEGLHSRALGTVLGARDASEIHPVARSLEEWQRLFALRGERAYRAGQVFRAIHAQGRLDPREITELPRALREELLAAGFAAPAELLEVRRASDGTKKLVLALAGGARVECVLIPMTKLSDDLDADASAAPDDDEDETEAIVEAKQRVTLCISTQFGCAMGCVFCASGQRGLVRGLSAAEIVAQVSLARRHLEPNETLRNLVFMGMGEPLHHYEETARAIRLLTHAEGIGLGLRRITVSTVGLVPEIRRLGEDFGGKIGLAVSLHAPSDAIRQRIVPMNRRYPMAELLAALRRYPLPKRRRITIEYTLIAGLNDSLADARALVSSLAGLRVKVNLIPMNPVTASPLRASTPERVAEFREALARAGLSCFVRVRRGDDVDAACGQLALSRELADRARVRPK